MPLEIRLLVEVPIISIEFDSILSIPPSPAAKVFIPIEELLPILNSSTTKLKFPALPDPKIVKSPDVPDSWVLVEINAPPKNSISSGLLGTKTPGRSPINSID